MKGRGARVALCCCAAIACLVLIYSVFRDFTSKFIYYPMRYPQGVWELQKKFGAQERWFRAADGTKLNAWWFPKPDARFATLFLHGNAGNVTHRIDHAEAILEAGSAFLVLDYRGYGKSQGRPSERGLYKDADAAYADLVQLGYAPDRIIVHGESLGTAVAADLAARKPCAGIVLESPLMSAGKVAATVLPFLGPLFIRGYDTYGKISDVRSPLLVIHGEADEIVPFSQGRAVFEAAHQPKQFWAVPRASHNDLLDTAGRAYVEHLRGFYQQLAQR